MLKPIKHIKKSKRQTTVVVRSLCGIFVCGHVYIVCHGFLKLP